MKGDVQDVNMQETARMILGLRSAGWTEEKINDFYNHPRRFYRGMNYCFGLKNPIMNY